MRYYFLQVRADLKRNKRTNCYNRSSLAHHNILVKNYVIYLTKTVIFGKIKES